MKHKYPRCVLIIWEDHWYDPDGETTSELAQAQGPKEMVSSGIVVAETETQLTLALDTSDPNSFRHHAYYDKRMIREVIEMGPHKNKKKGNKRKPLA